MVVTMHFSMNSAADCFASVPDSCVFACLLFLSCRKLVLFIILKLLIDKKVFVFSMKLTAGYASVITTLSSAHVGLM